jgi:hypothetical protein
VEYKVQVVEAHGVTVVVHLVVRVDILVVLT